MYTKEQIEAEDILDGAIMKIEEDYLAIEVPAREAYDAVEIPAQKIRWDALDMAYKVIIEPLAEK